MNLENKTNLLLDAIDIEDIDLEAAEHIINLSAEVSKEAGLIAAKLLIESTTVNEAFQAIIQVISDHEMSDSRKLKTISRLINSMPDNVHKSATESKQEKYIRLFRS